jgi:hypothetical protein
LELWEIREKAVVLHEYGGPEKLRFEENVPEPQISGSTVLIAAAAASVNPIDWKLRSGIREKDFPVYTSQLTAITTKTQWPYVQQYHLDIQRELARDTLAVLAYVGSKGTHLSQQLDRTRTMGKLPATSYTPVEFIIRASESSA